MQLIGTDIRDFRSCNNGRRKDTRCRQHIIFKGVSHIMLPTPPASDCCCQRCNSSGWRYEHSSPVTSCLDKRQLQNCLLSKQCALSANYVNIFYFLILNLCIIINKLFWDGFLTINAWHGTRNPLPALRHVVNT